MLQQQQVVSKFRICLLFPWTTWNLGVKGTSFAAWSSTMVRGWKAGIIQRVAAATCLVRETTSGTCSMIAEFRPSQRRNSRICSLTFFSTARARCQGNSINDCQQRAIAVPFARSGAHTVILNKHKHLHFQICTSSSKIKLGTSPHHTTLYGVGMS